MKSSLQRKLQGLAARRVELGGMLSDSAIMSQQNRFRELSKEYAKLQPIVDCFTGWQTADASLTYAQAMLSESDADMRALAEEEVTLLQAEKIALDNELKVLLLPEDPNDQCDVYLEIRAGTGGSEAALFVGDLFRMYTRYAEIKRWTVSIISASESDQGGYKEIIVLINGEGAYSQLKFESGAHRVQRIPTTESQGRIHTSACTVAIMPKVDEVTEVNINMNDVRVDTFRASGAGGQHVNKTDSAIRLTHIPTGTVVECQDERSQHKNKARALSLLSARILDKERAQQQQKQAAQRKSLVGSGDRSERIRTYNFPQGRVTDHRINLTLYQLDDFMQGRLDCIIQPLIHELQAEQLADMADE